MAKFLKWTGTVLLAVIILAVIIIGLLVTLVSPNRLKPVLVTEVMKHTGRQLTIDGDLSWSFFPYLGVKAGHMTLSNPAQFSEKTFAEIASATVGVQLLPLLQGKIESSGILLNGMKLNLQKNAAGQVNWDFTLHGEQVKNPPELAEKHSASVSAFSLAVSVLDVTNTSVSYSDLQTKKSYDVTQFELHAKNINFMEPFPMNTAFDFAAKNPDAAGHVTLSGDTSVNPAAKVYSFRNAEFTANVKQGNKKLQMKLSGNLLADLNQETLQWTDMKGQVENMSLTGDMNVSHLLSNPVAVGKMQIKSFNLKDTLNSIGQPVAALQEASDVSGDMNFSASADAVTAESNLKMGSLKAARLAMKNVAVVAHLQNGNLNLAPISASLYQGTLEGQATVNLNSASLPVALKANLANVQAEPLMKDLDNAKSKLIISGVGNVSVNITTTAADADTAVKNLNGTGNFSFNQGAVIGIDLGYLVDTAAAVVGGKSPSATNNDRTNFGDLKGTVNIQNGVVTNKDLNSDSPRFVTKGEGTINLVDQTIDYQVTTSLKQSDATQNLKNLYGITIPVSIKGNLSSPSVHLDSSGILKSATQQQVQKVTEKAKEQLKQRLNDKAGDLLKNFMGGN